MARAPKTETQFARAIRWASAKGWNVAALAKKLNLAPQNLTNWKRRGGDIPPTMWVACAAVLGRSLDELVGLVPDRGAPRPQAPVRTAWPFEWEIDRYEALPEEQRRDFRIAVRLALEGCEMEASRPNRRHSKLARR